MKNTVPNRIIYSLIGALPYVLIIIFSYLDPSGAGPHSSISSPLSMVIFGTLITAVVFFLFYFLETLNSAGTFLWWIIGAALVLLLIAILSGIYIHRDFYSYPWQFCLVLIILFLRKIELFKERNDYTAFSHRVFIFCIPFYVLIVLWEIFMGYAIVTRQEPRWIESIAYNIYNVVMVQVYLWHAISIKTQFFRYFRVEYGKVFFENVPIDEVLYLNDLETALFSCFLTSANHKANCMVIRENMTSLRGNGEENSRRCDECMSENWTVSHCRDYMNIKKNLVTGLNIKLKIAQLGVIKPAGHNKMRIKEDGWQYEPAKDIRIEIRPRSITPPVPANPRL